MKMDAVVSACWRWSVCQSAAIQYQPLQIADLPHVCNCEVVQASTSFGDVAQQVATAFGQRQRAFVLVENASPHVYADLLPELVETVAAATHVVTAAADAPSNHPHHHHGSSNSRSRRAGNFCGNASRLLREKVSTTKNIFRSTRLHPSITLLQHSEAAYHQTYPRIMAFYCHRTTDRMLLSSKSSIAEGATPLTEYASLQQQLPQEVVDHFGHRGVCFRRFLPSRTNPVYETMARLLQKHQLQSFLPLASWQDVFDCTSREELEVQLRNFVGATKIDWNDDDDSVVYTVPKQSTTNDPGVWMSPLNLVRFGGRTEEEVRKLLHLLEQVVLSKEEEEENPHHEDSSSFSLLDADAVAMFVDRLARFNWTVGWPCYATTNENNPNDKEIPEFRLEQFRQAVIKATVRFPWKVGSILVVDNIRAMHGREAFSVSSTKDNDDDKIDNNNDKERFITTAFA